MTRKLMRHHLGDVGVILVLCSVFLLFIVSGCGGGSDGGESEGGGSSSTETSTSQATDMGDSVAASVEAALGLVSGGGGASISPPPEGASLDVSPQKGLTVTATSSCAASTDTNIPTTVVATLSGSDLSSDGSGTCNIKASSLGEVFGSDVTVVALEFISFNGGLVTHSMTFDGTLLVMLVDSLLEGDTAEATVRVGSMDGFLLGFVENGSTRVVDLVVNMSETISFTIGSDSVSYTDTVSGCISVNDEAFSVSGYKSGSYSLQL